ncbi:hypothetical protein D4Q85_00330 [bacterium]|nr:MAG: hypothetical protein D4Q85_00330 [bacterium]
MDARQIIADLPAAMRVSLAYSGKTTTAGRASISRFDAISIYGSEAGYQASYYVDKADLGAEPTSNTRVTVDGTEYLILGVVRSPGNLRRLDVGDATYGYPQ